MEDTLIAAVVEVWEERSELVWQAMLPALYDLVESAENSPLN